MSIKNPEKECQKTPEHFSTTSKITSLNNSEFRYGIVLDSPEEFGQAIMVYDCGDVPKSGATES